MRALDRLVVLVLGLALLIGGGFLVIEVVQAQTNGRWLLDWPSWVHRLRTTGFDNGVALAAFAVALGVGVPLLVAALHRRPVDRLALEDEDSGWWVRRRGLERFLTQSVLRRTSVAAATIRVRRRHRIDAEITPHPGAGDLHPPEVAVEEVEACLLGRLDALELAEPLQVRVRSTR